MLLLCEFLILLLCFGDDGFDAFVYCVAFGGFALYWLLFNNVVRVLVCLYLFILFVRYCLLWFSRLNLLDMFGFEWWVVIVIYLFDLFGCGLLFVSVWLMFVLFTCRLFWRLRWGELVYGLWVVDVDYVLM